MKVFISWSGELSRQVALALRDWLPMVVQTVDPYVSSEDIDKGARWSSDISRELEDSEFGILCVTPQNIDAPWVNFEAGALSKSLDRSRVAPFLYRSDRTDVKGPLLQFQSTLFEREDVHKLVKSIHKSCGQTNLDETRLDELFDVLWPRLFDRLAGLADDLSKDAGHPQRSLEDLATEILELVRGQQKLLADPGQLLPIAYINDMLTRNRVSGSSIDEVDIVDLANRWDAVQEYIMKSGANVPAELLVRLSHLSRPIDLIVMAVLRDRRISRPSPRGRREDKQVTIGSTTAEVVSGQEPT